MFLVFNISQASFGPLVAEVLAGWIESFQSWVGGLVADASPLLQAILVDGVIGGVGAVLGFLPLVMVMYFLIALLEDCGYMARVSVVLGPHIQEGGTVRQVGHSLRHRHRLRHPGSHGLPHHSQ